MVANKVRDRNQKWPTLAQLPAPAKALVSMVILTMAIAMIGALGQIIVHDIIPTFFSSQPSGHQDNSEMSDHQGSTESDQTSAGRGDLFSEEPVEAEAAEGAVASAQAKLKDLMGHSSIQLTYDVYAGLFPSPKSDAEAMAEVQKSVLGF